MSFKINVPGARPRFVSPVTTDPPMGAVGLITFTRTYARRLDESDPDSVVETWKQVLERVVNACNDQLRVGFTPEEQNEVFDLMYNLKCSVAGRFLWQLGTRTVDRFGLLSLQNCSFVTVDAPVRPFTWTMDCLMLGSGVGYNILPEHVDKLPAVKAVKITRSDTRDADYIIPDSREGWVKLLGKTMKAHFYSGEGFSFSTVLLRSRGAPIKGFGGVSSGPEVLCEGIHKINAVLNKRAGQKLRSVDALDVMNIIGMIVVSGNVRRSAQIALGSVHDPQFMNAKRWDLGGIPNWRACSNNSVSCDDIADMTDSLWDGYNGNGEPYGLINLPLSRSCGRLGETQYPDPDVQGYNPCAEQSLASYETCVTGDTRIQTRLGCVRIRDVVGQSVDVFNGESWSTVQPFVALPEDEFLVVEFSDGSVLKVTPYHEFSVDPTGGDGEFVRVKADELQTGWRLPQFSLSMRRDAGDGDGDDGDVGTAYALGMFAGTGEVNPNASAADPQYSLWVEQLRDTGSGLPEDVMRWSRARVEAFLAGWVDSEDCYVRDGASGMFILQSHEQTVRDTQLLCRRANINHARVQSMHDGRGRTWVLNIPVRETAELPALSPWAAEAWGRGDQRVLTDDQVVVVGVRACDAREPSFCFSEPIRQMGVFGNVLTHQCCLSEIFLPNIASREELHTCVKYLYRINKHSLRLPCHHKETEAIVHRNMRMGIGVTGYLMTTEEQKSWLPGAYEMLREFDAAYSQQHGFPRSVKLTTVKPSGCARRDMLVQTTRGVLRLDEIGDVGGAQWQEVRHIGAFDDTVVDIGGEQLHQPLRVNKFYVNGEVDTRVIRTADGLEMEVSEQHRIKVVNQKHPTPSWVRAQDIQEGDLVLTVLGGHPETGIPSSIQDKQLAFVVGYAMASEDPSVFRMWDTRTATKFSSFFETGFRHRRECTSGGRRFVCSQDLSACRLECDCLVEVMRDNRFLQTARSGDDGACPPEKAPGIPECVRCASAQVARSFVYGYACAKDPAYMSSLKAAENRVCVSEFHAPEFAQQYLALARSVGVRASIGVAQKPPADAEGGQLPEYADSRVLDRVVSVSRSRCHTYDIEVEHSHLYRMSGAVSHNTLSLLAGVTSGVHPGYSRHYIRRIRFCAESPLVEACKAHGYHSEFVRRFDGSDDHSTVVVSFPYRLPDNAVLSEDVSAVQLMQHVKRLQTEWSDNSVSCSVYYRREELPEIKQWLRENYNTGVKSMSFLMHSDHGFDQAPMEPISRDTYERMVADTTPFKMSQGRQGVEDDPVESGECKSGTCPVR